MSTWQDLTRELDDWREARRIATFWWRDDDAITTTPALERLLGLHASRDAPLAIAAIPARATPQLAARLADITGVTVIQHGWAHENHAQVGAHKAELGPERPISYMLGELARGQIAMDRIFGDWMKVLVPPHNRIAPALAASLSQAGYAGLSTYRPRREAIPGLTQVNTHIDIMNWTTRRFVGTAAALELALAHLRARRSGAADSAEPTGLLTHHLAHDDDAWSFAEVFLDVVHAHPAARLCNPRELFGSA